MEESEETSPIPSIGICRRLQWCISDVSSRVVSTESEYRPPSPPEETSAREAASPGRLAQTGA